jgi:hypothetical protein
LKITSVMLSGKIKGGTRGEHSINRHRDCRLGLRRKPKRQSQRIEGPCIKRELFDHIQIYYIINIIDSSQKVPLWRADHRSSKSDLEIHGKMTKRPGIRLRTFS